MGKPFYGAERYGCYAIRRLGEGDDLKLADAKMSGMIVARAKELTAEGEDFGGLVLRLQVSCFMKSTSAKRLMDKA